MCNLPSVKFKRKILQFTWQKTIGISNMCVFVSEFTWITYFGRQYGTIKKQLLFISFSVARQSKIGIKMETVDVPEKS